jgi:hypothetical protein
MRYPRAANPKRVGKYPAVVKAGGGYVWDEVLEYRVRVASCLPVSTEAKSGHDPELEHPMRRRIDWTYFEASRKLQSDGMRTEP